MRILRLEVRFVEWTGEWFAENISCFPFYRRISPFKMNPTDCDGNRKEVVADDPTTGLVARADNWHDGGGPLDTFRITIVDQESWIKNAGLLLHELLHTFCHFFPYPIEEWGHWIVDWSPPRRKP